ncbi:MAG: hypothetical protein KBS59_00990, partial [Clostridiales bacterium]|nr:hypothetical protein [Clostridiales bacterium]
VFAGFDDLTVTKHSGTNPESMNSIVICASTKEMPGLYPDGPWIFISQVITKESSDPFTEDELFPINSVSMNSDGIGDVSVTMNNGREYTFSHSEFANELSI